MAEVEDVSDDLRSLARRVLGESGLAKGQAELTLRVTEAAKMLDAAEPKGREAEEAGRQGA